MPTTIWHLRVGKASTQRPLIWKQTIQAFNLRHFPASKKDATRYSNQKLTNQSKLDRFGMIHAWISQSQLRALPPLSWHLPCCYLGYTAGDCGGRNLQRKKKRSKTHPLTTRRTPRRWALSRTKLGPRRWALTKTKRGPRLWGPSRCRQADLLINERLTKPLLKPSPKARLPLFLTKKVTCHRFQSFDLHRMATGVA